MGGGDFVTIATILGTGILGPVDIFIHRTFTVSLCSSTSVTKGGASANHVIKSKGDNIQPPNLHLLGELFLGGCCLRYFFDIILVLQFVALLISYALAGSEAYAQIIGVNYFYIIPVFVWLLSFAIVFALRFIQPVVSFFTFFKGSLLLGTVIVTFYVGAEVHREIKNDFMYTGAPFLMGTVALGGVINTMPLMYSKINPVYNEVKNFCIAVISGLLTCTVLNVLWCWAVLDIVPQLSKVSCSQSKSALTNTESCYNNISLESAADRGEISTIPLTKIIEQKYPTFYWVALLVEIFIMVSITVSYLTIGAVLHHTLSGWLKSVWSKGEKSKEKRPIIGLLTSEWYGFVEMLEKFSSFTLNMEAALFVFIMLHKASQIKHKMNLKIPMPVPDMLLWLRYLIPIYFGFAVIYDVYRTVKDIISEYSPMVHNSTVNKLIHTGSGDHNGSITMKLRRAEFSNLF
ncbi:hypothetical protein KUTeg_011718 [Tegillarca granosa]|uniref:Uncharacterized protein n=1 Tax=Tegillarca granosa TaxID=220873 RepID=A0ABQ9F2R5_TEGGR|nr:hypothetical protein KUTeg_011718 [Tegillarca granosa]